jgi:predicted metal-dependent HD superfamily phosphohydrolase
MHLRQRWNTLWGHHYIERTFFEWYETLAQFYNGRPYFHLGYIARLLYEFDSIQRHVFLARKESFEDVEKALWFREIYRYPRRRDNEEQSAQFADMLMRFMHQPNMARERVMSLIIATKHAHMQFAPDHQLICDLDLVKFARSADEYDRMLYSIRKENKHLIDLHYAGRRLYDLESLTRREHLYYLPIFKERYEAQARANIEREMALWERVLRNQT